mgnify:CR=1 FL=1
MQEEGRILAIDYGTKRVGLAVTDENCIIPGALDTVLSHEAMNYIINYSKHNKIKCFVIGEPKKLDNSESEIYKIVIQFGKALKKKFPDIPVVLLDERFTSKIAYRSIIESGIKKSKRQNKSLIDSVSAVILLQSYMDIIKNENYKPLLIN